MEKDPTNAGNFAPEQRAEKTIGALKQHKPVFVLVILPDKDSPIYGKQLLNRKQGAHLYQKASSDISKKFLLTMVGYSV